MADSYNINYIEGRAAELFVDKWLIMQGFITLSTRGSKNSYDLIVIDPNKNNDNQYLI